MIQIFLYLIIFITNNNFSNNYIILPFNHEKSNFISNEISFKEEIINFLKPYKPYTLIALSDKITSEFYISLNHFYFFLGKGLCRKETLSNYSLEKTNSFKNISYCADEICNINNVSFAIDKISLFNNIKLSENITFNRFRFLFGVNVNKNEIYDISKICGIIGLKNEYNNLKYKDYNFIKILKKERIIPSYKWSILYFNDKINFMVPEKIKNSNQGLLMIGIENQDYNEIFSTEDIRTTKTKPRFGMLDWGILFNEIYFENNSSHEISCYQKNVQVSLDLESDFIIGTKYFFENIKKSFFKQYIEQNICYINKELKQEGKYIIICDKSFSIYISSFPNLYIFHKEFNFTFILTNQELFKTYGNHIYFLIIYKLYYADFWSIGTIFLKKYPLLFDYDKKSISFVNIYNRTNKNITKEYNKKESWINFKSFWSFFKNLSIFIGIVIGILIGKKIWDKSRKKRVNELIDEYQYNAYENKKNENKDIKSKENKLYEMN